MLGQVDFRRHLKVHWQMLRIGWLIGDRREVLGQVLRIVPTPLGHLFGRLPLGNTGRANVSAFEPMAIPPNLQVLIEDRGR